MALLTFTPFGATHGIALLVVCVLLGAAVRVARRVRNTRHEATFRRTLAGFILAVNLPWTLYVLTPGKFDLQYSLPIQLCDLAWMLAAWSMLRRDRADWWGHQLLYYWGIGLSTIAFITPTVTQGPSTVSFWRFFATHAQIACAALANVFAFGVVPDARGLRASIRIGLPLLLLATLFNAAFGTNYWFSGDVRTDNPTPVDLLGPWPWRVVLMAALASFGFVLLWLPFRRVERRTTHSPPSKTDR